MPARRLTRDRALKGLVAGTLLWATGCAGALQAPRPPDEPNYVHFEPEVPPAPPPPPPLPPRPEARPRARTPAIAVEEKSIRGQALTVVRIDLRRVEPRLQFAYGTGKPLRRVETFTGMWRRAGSHVVASGTFYGVRTRETMGTIVSGGKVLQAPDWDNRGSALVIDRGGQARMITLRMDGRPRARDQVFWLQAGPRLIRNRQIWYRPRLEGFRHPSLFARNRRMAIGIAGHGRTMLLVAFKEYPTLQEAAVILRDLGVSDAMNLDGGPSAGLAVGGRLVLAPDSPLTHVLVMKPTRIRLGTANATSASR